MKASRHVLGPLFTRVLSTVALSSVGCGGVATSDAADSGTDASSTTDAVVQPTPNDGGIVDLGFAEPAGCGDGGEYDYLAGIRPADPTDALIYRRDFMRYGADAACSRTSSTNFESRFGDPCAGKSDRSACEATLDCMTSTTGWKTLGQVSMIEYFIGVHGGAPVTIGDRDTLVRFLGTIDTPSEAVLLSVLGDRSKPCQTYRRPAVAYKALTSGGYEVLFVTGSGCGKGNDIVEHRVRVDADGTETELETKLLEAGNPQCAEGRRPEGLLAPIASSQPSSTAAYLAEAAHLEAASIIAFERLESELVAHGAPERLVRDANRSRGDEVRHARTMARLAKKYGGNVARVDVAPHRVRTLEEIAIENVVEGCVRETYAALVALYQSHHAVDPEIAVAMHAIAKEETFHAGLAWDVHAWLVPKLDIDARRRVEAARVAAVDTLFDELAVAPDASLQSFAGLPSARDAVALLDAMQNGIAERLSKGNCLAA